MLKKTTLAVIGLAASGFASAGSMGPVCTPGNVTVPCEARAWDLGIQALYLRSLYDADKALQPTLINNLTEIKNDWSWGFRAEGSYHFNTGDDITIDWTHYSTDNNITGLNGVLPIITPFGTFASNSAYQVVNKNRLDQVNVVLGQHVDVGLVKKMRFYGGLQYANLQTNATNYYAPFPPATAILVAPLTSIDFFNNADFKGFGPVLGLDYSYNITPEISVTANGAGSILYGTTRYNAGFVGEPVQLVLSSMYRAKKAIVPTVQAKLGLNYAYIMPQGVMNIEGGYQVMNYFNVLQTQSLQNLTNPIVTSNYGLYGPYIGVKYLGNA